MALGAGCLTVVVLFAVIAIVTTRLGVELPRFLGIAALGAGATVAYAVNQGLRARAPEPPSRMIGAGMVCGSCGKSLSPYWKRRCEHCKAAFADYPPIPPGQTGDRS